MKKLMIAVSAMAIIGLAGCSSPCGFGNPCQPKVKTCNPCQPKEKKVKTCNPCEVKEKKVKAACTPCAPKVKACKPTCEPKVKPCKTACEPKVKKVRAPKCGLCTPKVKCNPCATGGSVFVVTPEVDAADVTEEEAK